MKLSRCGSAWRARADVNNDGVVSEEELADGRWDDAVAGIVSEVGIRLFAHSVPGHIRLLPNSI